ncbi:MAG: patatin-like phospholipase family protein [Fusobacteriaceae bacterium]|jgi:NTE family protein|nr:patatin-like phospholipase family protein [Fusobacteriaceae bacterium]
MSKKLFCLLFIFVFLLGDFSQGSGMLSAEDREINDLKTQIKALETKLKLLEEAKQNKVKSDRAKPTGASVSGGKGKDRKALKVGLALSGGGAKGLVHVGVLKELERNNIRIDYITGTSVGAIIAALYSAGYTPDQIEEYLRETDWSNLASLSSGVQVPLERKFNKFDYMVALRYDKSFKFSMPKAFVDNEYVYFRMKNAFAKAKNNGSFRNARIPLGVVATDLNTGKPVLFRNGDMAKAVAASSAVPTIFEPVKIGEHLYVDGMMSQNIPVQAALEMGADVVIASNVGNVLKDNADYNIVGIINQLMAIPAADSMEEQKKLATVLISPDMDAYSAVDTDKSREFVEIGEKAAREKLPQLKNFPRKTADPAPERKPDLVYIENIIFGGALPPRKLAILRAMLEPLRGKTFTHEALQEKIMQIYGQDFVDEIYYRIERDILYVDISVNPSNLLGLGVNYRSGYGTTLNVGTEFSNIGKIGNSMFVNLQLGDYMGFDIKNFFYYGSSNKIGLFANLSFQETPFYLYGERKKLAEYINNTAKLEIGVAVRFRNKLFLTYGIDSRYTKLEQKIDANLATAKQAEYSKNINNTFLRITWDKLNSLRHPTAGYKIDLNHMWGGSFGKRSVNYYRMYYQLEGYVPFDEKTTLQYGIIGGLTTGKNIYLDQYFKFGGISDNPENGEFSFAGYRAQQMLVKQFLTARVGIEREFLKNLYLGVNIHFGTFEELNSPTGKFSKSDMWKNPVQGVGLSVLYETLLGPVKFSLSSDERFDRFLTEVSVGYRF